MRAQWGWLKVNTPFLLPATLAGNSERRCGLLLGLEKQKLGMPPTPDPHPAELSLQKHLLEHLQIEACLPTHRGPKAMPFLLANSLTESSGQVPLAVVPVAPFPSEAWISHPPFSSLPGPKGMRPGLPRAPHPLWSHKGCRAVA